MSQTPAPRSKPRWTGVSIALFVIGLLILVPSGLCSGMVLLSMLGSLPGYPAPGIGPDHALSLFFGNLYIVLIFGGVPMALGAVLVYSGLKSRRRE